VKTIASTFTAALIASASFAGAAFAAGDYYDGVWPNQDHQTESVRKTPAGSYGYTGSISNGARFSSWNSAENTVDRGDYYEGVNRPS